VNGLLNLHPKVAGGGVSGSLALIILTVVGHWYAVTPNVAAAFTVILTVVGAYLSPVLNKEAAAVAADTAAPPPPK